MASSSGPQNEELREVVQHFKEKLNLEESKVFCDICDERKQKAVKSCLTCQSSYCDDHLEPHLRVPRLKKHKLINAVENLEDYICQKQEKPLCNQLVQTQTDIQQMIQDRMKKIQEIQYSVGLKRRNTEKEKSSSVEIFTDLMHSIQRCQFEHLKMMEEQQRAAEKQAADLINELQQEITELKKRNTEMNSSLSSRPHTKNWTEIRIDSDVNLIPLYRALTQLKNTLNKKFYQTVDVSLDLDTAYPYLILSDDGKQVSDGDIEQDVPENPKRFDESLSVLAEQGFSSGKFYYEVLVKGKTEWTLGVAKESINRKEDISPSPEDGIWTVILRNENRYSACENSSILLSLKVKPEKVGVFVDYEEGLVSFYNVGSSSHIYSFTGQTFTEKLYPYFGPGLNDKVMASSSGPALNEELQCPICMEEFPDPVTTPCGHNICRTCLTNNQTCFCPFCKERSSELDLESNTAQRLTEVMQNFKEKLNIGESGVVCDFCDERHHKKAVKSCLTCQSSYCDDHLEPHLRIPRLKKHKLINAVENLEDYICQKHKRPLEMFCRDDQTCVCLFCTEEEHRTHNTVPIEEESREKKLVQTDMQQMIQDKMKENQESEHSVEPRKASSSEVESAARALIEVLARGLAASSSSGTSSKRENVRLSEASGNTPLPTLPEPENRVRQALKRDCAKNVLLKDIQVQTLRDPAYSLQSDIAYGSNEGNSGLRKLTLIPTDSDGYSTRLLKSVSKNGKNMLFVVPLQEQLSIEPLPYDAVEFAKMPPSNCMKCGKKIPLSLLPLHIEECKTTETESVNDVILHEEHDDEIVSGATDQPSEVCLELATIKGHSKMCSFITQHNATDVASFEGACNGMLTAGMSTRAVECSFLYHKPSPKAFQRIWQYIQPASQPQTMCTHTSPGPSHPASSPPRSSETSHPDSCCNNRFAKPKNFCTNCQKPSQGSSSVCSSSSSGSRPDCSSSS
ncbi:E3 ubiquitin-protein ligase TRIM39 [Anabarilius grahami]|uniref:E3 ubiquitin-protein ligase TRIM39 n=1 Tax=Anabarilius grahami TaxID=495550 RepID=A0A3N0Y4S3_ANAGA|nr:E3 ubiquitin-protein ligase TRIM39 [Anabarilius grahami]